MVTRIDPAADGILDTNPIREVQTVARHGPVLSELQWPPSLAGRVNRAALDNMPGLHTFTSSERLYPNLPACCSPNRKSSRPKG